jgi:hypothetical protein
MKQDASFESKRRVPSGIFPGMSPSKGAPREGWLMEAAAPAGLPHFF